MSQRSDGRTGSGRHHPDWEAGPPGIIVHEPTRCFLPDCRRDHDLVDVAIVERMSGPGWTLRACGRCVDRHGILPLDEHPADSPGDRVLHRSRPRAVDTP